MTPNNATVHNYNRNYLYYLLCHSKQTVEIVQASFFNIDLNLFFMVFNTS